MPSKNAEPNSEHRLLKFVLRLTFGISLFALAISHYLMHVLEKPTTTAALAHRPGAPDPETTGAIGEHPRAIRLNPCSVLDLPAARAP